MTGLFLISYFFTSAFSLRGAIRPAPFYPALLNEAELDEKIDLMKQACTQAADEAMAFGDKKGADKFKADEAKIIYFMKLRTKDLSLEEMRSAKRKFEEDEEALEKAAFEKRGVDKAIAELWAPIDELNRRLDERDKQVKELVESEKRAFEQQRAVEQEKCKFCTVQ